jgi:hypothetical protein
MPKSIPGVERSGVVTLAARVLDFMRVNQARLPEYDEVMCRPSCKVAPRQKFHQFRTSPSAGPMSQTRHIYRRHRRSGRWLRNGRFIPEAVVDRCDVVQPASAIDTVRFRSCAKKAFIRHAA